MVDAKTHRLYFKSKLELVTNCAWTKSSNSSSKTNDGAGENASSIVFLDALEEEIANEKKERGGGEGSDEDVNEEFAERVVYSRLSFSPSSSSS